MTFSHYFGGVEETRGTTQKSIYLPSHAGAMIGLPAPEARTLIRDLTERATQRRSVCAYG